MARQKEAFLLSDYKDCGFVADCLGYRDSQMLSHGFSHIRYLPSKLMVQEDSVLGDFLSEKLWSLKFFAIDGEPSLLLWGENIIGWGSNEFDSNGEWANISDYFFLEISG